MQIELYRETTEDAHAKATQAAAALQEHQQEARGQCRERIQQLTQQHDELVKMQFFAQARMVMEHLTKEQYELSHLERLSPDYFYPSIDAKTWEIWAWYLPTAHWGIALQEYHFDLIPLEVLTEWQFAKSLDLFDAYWIRTPKTRKTDPILLGWRYGVPYLLARWGESLLPWETIQKIVARRKPWFGALLFPPDDLKLADVGRAATGRPVAGYRRTLKVELVEQYPTAGRA
jgi:hypothetical protein